MVLLMAGASVAYASHSWGGYHWPRTANPFTVKLGDNVTSQWDSNLNVAASDWTLSSVLNTNVIASNAGKNCRTTLGRVEVCNSKYGNNGWLGIASIWVSGNHITKGTVKLNDTYFSKPAYNTPQWRQLVMCQEIGHTFGLDHQDENFTNLNLGTCMDYTNNPGANQHPNAHDFEQLEYIYAHLDSQTVAGQNVSSKNSASDTDENNLSDWGREVRKSKDGKTSLFEKDLGKGNKIFTFVIWTQ